MFTRELGSINDKELLQQGSKLLILYAPFEAKRRAELPKAGYGDPATKLDNIRSYECDITLPESVTPAFTALEKDYFSRPLSSPTGSEGIA